MEYLKLADPSGSLSFTEAGKKGLTISGRKIVAYEGEILGRLKVAIVTGRVVKTTEAEYRKFISAQEANAAAQKANTVKAPVKGDKAVGEALSALQAENAELKAQNEDFKQRLAALEAKAGPAKAAEEEEEADKYTAEELEKMTVQELTDVCEAWEIALPSGKKKADLIAAILATYE